MCTGTHAFIPAPNTARVRMVYSLFGQTVMNVFYWQGDAPLIASDLSGLADEVNIAWAARFKPVQAPDVELLYIEATALDTDSSPSVTLAVGVAGTASGVSFPGGTTLAIKFSGGVSGRSGRGRMYWIQLHTAQISGDQVTSADVAAIVGLVSDFFDDIETATGLTHVVTSYCHDGAWRTTASNTPVVNYIATDNNVDSQRRRLAGRGI